MKVEMVRRRCASPRKNDAVQTLVLYRSYEAFCKGIPLHRQQWVHLTVKWNAFAERWVVSVKAECLDHLILFGERSLAHALENYVAYHQNERNHQGLGNVIPFPDPRLRRRAGEITKSERLGGLLNFYHYQEAA